MALSQVTSLKRVAVQIHHARCLVQRPLNQAIEEFVPAQTRQPVCRVWESVAVPSSTLIGTRKRTSCLAVLRLCLWRERQASASA